MNEYSQEFPLLDSIGLYAANISGDGDCLFHALSDQLYGHENKHREIRARVVEHMRAHESYFKLFLSVSTSPRRPRKRRVAAAATVPPSSSAIDQAFSSHLARMSKSGVYGDNLEISAFAREYGCNVKIYQRDFAYVVTGDWDGNEDGRKTVHIGYHTWEHYSSIRNSAGPHTGIPNVSPTTQSSEAANARTVPSSSSSSSSYVLPWMEAVVARSLPHQVDPARIREVLEEYKGKVDAAVSKLLDEAEEEEEEGEGGGNPPACTANASSTSPEQDPEQEIHFEGQNKEEIALGGSEVEMEPGRSAGGGNAKEKTAAQALAAPKAKVVSKNDAGSGDRPENTASIAGESQKQRRRPKRESAREKKAKQKAAAKAKKKEKLNPGAGSGIGTNEKSTAGITSAVKELYI